MAVKDKSSKKQVRDIKGQDDPKTIGINPGNISVLTIKLLDTIAQTLARIEKKLDG